MILEAVHLKGIIALLIRRGIFFNILRIILRIVAVIAYSEMSLPS
jgi:hypothetical protein